MYIDFKHATLWFLAALSCRAGPISNTPNVLIERDANIAVPNQYTVRMTSGMTQGLFDITLGLVQGLMGETDEIRRKFFFSDFRAFSMEASPNLLDSISQIAGIEEITPNYILHDATQSRQVQLNCTYGLDRITHRLNGHNKRDYEFIYYDPPLGQGVTIYVIDSGILAEHVAFGDRVTKGANYAPPSSDGRDDWIDYIDHGTHVAGIAAGGKYGVARRSEIVDVRIINADDVATEESQISGIAWAANDAEERGSEADSVLNMSFGGFAHRNSNIVNWATRAAIRQGLLCVIAAGNKAIDVQGFSPPNTEEACTVGATNEEDVMYIKSNYGQGIDIWAPGVGILAPSAKGPMTVVKKDGTSMAAPFVAGVAAYLKSFGGGFASLSPQEACQNLQDLSTKDKITFRDFAEPPGPNYLLYDGNV